jgi:titin
MAANPNPVCSPTSTVTTKGVTTVTFKTVGTCDWTVPAGVATINADVVAGGGSGAAGDFGGGGGGGGQVVMLRQIAVTADATKEITVGSGGASPVVATTASSPGVSSLNGNDGASSTFDTFVAQGGKGGLKNPSIPVSSPNGGAGGGSFAATTITSAGTVSTVLNAGGAGSTAQPTNCVPGRNGGGGAGSLAVGLAGSATATSGNGGAGVSSGTLNAIAYGGGGGGARETGGTTGVSTGGTGGGGAGGRGNTTIATYVLPINGTPGTGGGGGGNGGQCNVAFIQAGARGGAGGSGAVVIQFANPVVPTVTPSSWQGFNQLSWDAYPDTTTTGYKVYWSTSPAALLDSATSSLPAANVITVSGAANTSYTHPNLTLGTSYYYRVAATYLNVSNAAVTSLPSVVTSAVIPRLTDTVRFISNDVNNTPRTVFAPQDFTVPANVNVIKVNAFGASANTTNASWNTGGSVLANLSVNGGNQFKLFIGSRPLTLNGVNIAGWNGGGTSGHGIEGFGGGGTDLRFGGVGLADRVVVAGGGGGRSGGYWAALGGGLIGGTESGGQVSGGTQTGPGAAPAGTPQIFGTFGVGASASNASGAGGGGWWGGNSNSATYGGGGGSSYTVPSAYNVVHTQGGNVGDGFITITYAAQSQVPTGVKAIPGQAQNTIAWDRTDISSADGYRVYGGTTPNPTTLIATVTGVNRTAFVHTGLINGTTYYYRVAAAVPAATNNTAAILTGYSLEVAATPNFMATENFNVTRAKQTWTVPQGVTWIQVVARGASANTTNASWNTGGTVSAIIPVTPGEVLNLYVGSRPQTINGLNTIGYNGGGTSGYGIEGFGGGGTDIRKGGDALSNRVIVAGGGAGRSGGYWSGAGGGLVGGTESGGQVAGGTQSGPGPQPAGIPQILGTLGVGASTTSASGAGGGGYWGGNSNTGTYGGGGGSSYADPTSVNVVHTQGGVVGDGSIAISYPTVAYPVGVQAIAGQGLNTIIWDESKIQGATGYRVYGGTNPNPTTLLTATAVAYGTNTFTHTGLTLGTTYYYRVSVMSGTLESQRSAEVSAIPSFTVDKTYNLTRGLQTFTVPSGVFWIRSTVKGASANTTNASWNTGGTVSAILPVTPGEVLNLYVGGQPDVINGVNTLGYNGGGSSGYGIQGFGGGASDIRRGGTALADRIMVAGGGAGRSGGYWSGAGGGLVGGTESGGQVSGGTQSGPGVQPAGIPQIFGSLGVGASTTSASGAGGGGYWGGNSNTATYGGGGGSSYTDPSAVNVVHTQGGVVGNGSITISFSLNQAPQNFVAIPGSNRVSLSWTRSEITGLQDYQIFRRTATGAETLLATVVAPTLVHVDNTAVNGVTYFYRLVARAVVNNVALATASTSDVVAAPTPAVTVSFNATRAPQNWVVPSGVSWIQVVARGASANTTNGSWNTGGQVTASLPVTPGETLALYVGGQPKTVNGATVWGWNGGGTSGYGVTGGGGGATDIRRGGDLLGNRVLVAGGGAGRSGGYWSGAGGGLIGGTESGGQVSGGTQTGPGFQPGSVTQIFGTLGVGASTTSASGAGGGGYWGGNSNTATYGGGGGSSYAAPNAVNVVHTQGGVVGDGSITITYVIDTVAPTVTGITSPAVNTKTYKAGEDIFIDVNFSESVSVTGSPTLDINTGAGGRRTISYVSGNGTASLRFLYTVLSGDDITNIDAWSTTALSTANGANIADAAGNNASLNLPALGSPTSLSSRLLVVDGIVPAPPVLVGASGSTQITIDWSDVAAPDLLKYNIYVSTDGVNYSQLNSVLSSASLPVSIFTQQVVARGITYFYYVTAVDLRGNESDPSVITSWSIAADGTIQTPSVQVKSPTNNLLQPITGTAVPGSTVTIMDGGVVVGTVTAHATTGLYSYTPSLLDQWTVGTHSITAKASLNGVESSPTVISTMLIDTVAPTFVSQLRSSPLSEKTSSVVLVWRLTFSEPMTGLDASDFVVSGTTAVVASLTQTIGSRTSYDVRVTGGNIGSVEGNIALAFAPAMSATDVAGNALADTTPSGLNQNFILDHTYPTMTLASDKVALGAGGTAVITFTSSIEPVAGEFVASDVSVTGGTLSGFAGSGTVYTATFTPTVGFSGAAAIDVIAGSYNSVSGLPNMRATQLLITVDTVAPTVSNVTAATLSASYRAGTVVPISVVFGEIVNVVGVPTLRLETGVTDQTAVYASGSGTSTLIFNYTVVAGDISSDLNYFDTASLVAATGASIRDAALNSAVLTLPAITAGTAGNLATNAAIVIDTVAPNAPTALTLTPVGAPVVANTLNTANTNLTASATITAASATGGSAQLLLGTSVLATDSTISAADTTVTFDLGSSSTAALQSAITVGGLVTVRVLDAAGNLSNASTAVTLIVDFVRPAVSAFAGLAATVNSAQTITITTSETVTGFTTADIVASCVGTGAVTGSGFTYTYTWTPPTAFTGSCTFTVAAGNFSDVAGNTSVLFTTSAVVDTAAPTVTGVTAVSPNGTYIVGQTVDVTVNFSEPVIVAGGTPTLAIRSSAAGTSNASYLSGSSTNKLVFRYTISVGDNSVDLNYAATTSLSDAGATIRDAAGNNATLTLPAVTAGTAGNLATNAAIVVDALAPNAPAAPSITVVGGTVVATFINSTNTNITAVVTGLIAGDVTGGRAELLYTPNGGTAAVVAVDSSISATDTSASFDLGVTSNTALQALITSAGNGTGTFAVRLTDVSGNVSASGTSTAALNVDYVRPTVLISTATTGTLNSTQTAAIVFTSSEATSNFATGDATANLGTLGAMSVIVGGAPNRYTSAFTPNASGNWSVLVAASTFTDAAGNPNSTSAPLTGVSDVTPATAVRVSALDGLYKSGDNIDITVEFSEAVNVANTRTVTLSNSRTATYLSGSGTSAVVFRYTVQAGDQVLDLNYAATGAWSGTGNVTDLAGNVSASVSLPSAGSVDSLSSTSTVNIDALAPVAANAPTFVITGSSVANTLNRASVNLSISSSWTTADSTLSQAEFLLNGTVIGTVNIANAATATSVTLNMNTTTSAQLQEAIPTGGSVTVRLIDIAGNSATSGASTLFVDFLQISLALSLQLGTIISGQTRTISFNLSETAAPATFTSSDVTATNGTISNFSGSGSSYTALFTPTSNFEGSAAISVAAGVMTDLAANPNAASATVTLLVDTLAPTATLAATAATSSENEITFTVTANEAIDCSTLAVGAGIDFLVTNGALISIDQTTDRLCTMNLLANATRGSPKTVSITSASTFSISDANGNQRLSLLGAPATTLVTLAGYAPSAPSSVSAAAAAAQALVTWVAPADFGGDPAVTYTVQRTSAVSPTEADWVTLAGAEISISATSATVISLTNGNSYQFRVRATNAFGVGAWSTASSSVVPFDVASAPIISATAGSNKIDLNITALSNNGSTITAYQYSINGGATWVAFGSTAASQTISSLVNGTTYTVRVRAINAAGAGPAVTSSPLTPLGQASAPTISAITALNASAVISFAEPTDNGGAPITNYKYSLNDGAFTALSPAATTSPITISGLSNGETYSIKLLAVSGALDGLASNTMTVTPMTTPSAPTSLTATSANSSASISFTSGANGGAAITAYQYSIDSGASWVSANTTSSPVLVTGLTNGNSYDILVRAVNAVGAGASATINSVAVGTRPSAPQIGVVTGTSGSITLPFTLNDNGAPVSLHEYQLRENPTACAGVYDASAANGTPWSSWTPFSPSNSSLVLTGLTNGTCYEVSIRATNSFGVGDASRSSGKPISDPGAPTINSITRGNSLASVVFEAPSDNGGLAIVAYEYSIDGGSNWIAAGLTSPFVISNLTNGTAYSVQLRTKTQESPGSFRYSSATGNVTVTPATVPAAVVISSAVPGNGFIDLNIYDPNNVANNGGSVISTIQYSLDGGATWTNASWTAGSSSVRVSGLTNSTSSGYEIQLRAVNSVGIGASSLATATITSGLVAAAPSISVTASDSKLSLSYTPGNNGGFAITGYRYSIDGNTWFAVSSNPMLIENLTNGTTYTVLVQAINAKGFSASASASATPAGAASAPTVSISSNGSTTSTVSFVAPTNTGGVALVLTGYEISTNGGLTWQPATIATGNLAAGTINLTSLTNGVSYSVRLRALNAFGAGAASTSVTASPVASAPAAPAITLVAERNRISVSLTQASDGGAPISSYEYTIDGGTTWIGAAWVPGSALSFNILGLSNGTSYNVQVRAINSAGAGAASTSATATPTGAAAALSLISAYTAAAGQTRPTSTDFNDLGVTSVTAANLAAINSILASLPTANRDSAAEIQLVVNAYNKLAALANGANDVSNVNAAENLTLVEWALLGVTLTADQALLANDFADELFVSSVDSAGKLVAFRTAISNIIPISNALTLVDAQVLGLTNVNAGNVGQLQNLIASQTAVSAVDTRAEVLALAAEAVLAFARNNALAIIADYAGNNAAPAVSDFVAAGVTGADSSNLAAILELIGPASSTQTDSTAEVQAYVVAINKIRTAANGSSTVAATLNPADFAALGLATLDTATKQSLFNQMIAGDGFAALDSVAERSALAAIIERVAALAAVTPPATLPNPTLSISDLSALGITGVTPENLASVLAAIAASANDGSGVDSVAKLQALASAAIAGQAATSTISGYTGASGQTAPTVANFAAAGVTQVTAANLSLINAYLAALPSSSRDSAAEIQAIVDAVNHIIAQANSVADNATFMTATDLTVLSIATTPSTASAELALLNSALDSMSATAVPSPVDTLVELREIARIISAIAGTAAGATANPALTVADFAALGVSGVTTANLAATLNQITATLDNASGVDSIAKIDALVQAANQVAARDNALAILMNYTADSAQVAPTSSIYSDAGVTSVNGLNLDAINSLIAALPIGAKNTTQEIQAVVDAYSKISGLANVTASGTITAALSAAEFAALGLSVIDSATEVTLMNAYLDTSAASAVDSASELAALAAAVAKLAATAAVTPPGALPSDGLTVADLAALGINGVTPDNLTTVLAFIANSANDASGVASKTALQALVDLAAAQALKDAAATQLSLYDGTGALPTRNQYSDAGVVGVDLSNRDTVNSILAALTPAQSDTTAELQAIVDSVAKIRLLADSTAANMAGNALTTNDFAAIGLGTIDSAAEIALFNAILDSSAISAVDSASELAEISRIVQAIMATAAGLTPSPALSPADFALIGVPGVDAENLSATLALIAATADNGSGVDSLTKLIAIQSAGQAAAAIEQAMRVISSYDGNNQAPVLSTYATAGITGVTLSNLSAVNAYLSLISSAQSDSLPEVQAVVDAVNKLAALADSTVSTGTALTSADLTVLGVVGFTGSAIQDKMALLNSVLDASAFASVDSPSALAYLIDIINRVVNKSLGQVVVPELSPSDFAALGINGVTSTPDGGNLSVVLAAIAGSTSAGVNSISKLESIVSAAIAEFNTYPSLKVIIDYADNNTNPAPTATDYTAIPGVGNSLVDASTLEAVNAIIEAQNAAGVGTVAKVSQLLYDFFFALGKIVNFARDAAMNTSPTLEDYRAAGLRNMEASNVAAMNAVIAGLQATDVDSPGKLRAILTRLLAASGNAGSPGSPGTTAPISKITLNETAQGTVISWTGATSVSVEIISSTGVVKRVLLDGKNQATLNLDTLEPGRAYAVLVSPTGSTDPADGQRIAYSVAPAVPTKTVVAPIAANTLQLSWTQEGFAKQYKIVATPVKGKSFTFTTTETKVTLNVIAGRKYDVTVTAIGEGDKTSTAVMLDVNIPGAISTVVATPISGKRQTLVSWNPLFVKPNAKYVVRVDGKIVCTSVLTSCAVPQTLNSRQDVVVSLVGGVSTAVEIVDSKLTYKNDVGFIPNTTLLAPGAVAEILSAAKDLKKEKYTTVIVTGHANPVNGIPLKISTDLANKRALVIVKLLKKQLPGVRIIAVGRSVFSPSNPAANQSLGNIRAEIYGTR